MKNDEILVKLANRTIKYFRNNLELPVESSYEIVSVDKLDYLDITTLITLSDDMSGTVGFSVSNDLALYMVENIIYGNVSSEEMNELASENVAETLNIILGNILKELTVIKKGGSINISTPYTMHNSVSLIKKRDGLMYLCKLKSNNEVMLLSYFV